MSGPQFDWGSFFSGVPAGILAGAAALYSRWAHREVRTKGRRATLAGTVVRLCREMDMVLDVLGIRKQVDEIEIEEDDERH